jgi:nitric oxide dioxygenase
MDWRDIELVQSSFRLLAAKPEAAGMFYERLFEIDPSLRALIRPDATKLVDSARLVVSSLRSIERLSPALAAVGRKYAMEGVRDEHYASIGAALVDTLRSMLGRRHFTEEVRNAWLSAYAVVATAMINAVADADTAEMAALAAAR